MVTILVIGLIRLFTSSSSMSQLIAHCIFHNPEYSEDRILYSKKYNVDT